MDDTSDSQDPRWIQLRPSRMQLAVTLFGASLAMAILWLMDLPPWLPSVWRWVLIVAVGLQIAWALWRHGRRDQWSIDAFYFIELDPDIEKMQIEKTAASAVKLGIRLKKGGANPRDQLQGEVLTGAFVMPWFATVPYRLPGDGALKKIWPRTLPLWRDSMNAEDFRAVRVRLRWT